MQTSSAKTKKLAKGSGGKQKGAIGEEEAAIAPLTARQTQLLLKRACKLLVHELGHLYLLGHCVYSACCMNGSGHLEEDFKQPMMLCPVDLKKLKMRLGDGFDLRRRMHGLHRFYQEQGEEFAEEAR